MNEKRTESSDRGIECPSCACRHMYVIYTRHRGRAIVRVRRCRHCQRRIVTHERPVGTHQAKVDT